jgi:hypothetical protein
VTGVKVDLAALVAGTGLGVTDAAKSATTDAYSTLRDLLRGRLVGRPHALEALEAVAHETGEWAPQVRADLEESGVGRDPAILEAAQRLLNAADSQGSRAGKDRGRSARGEGHAGR